MRKPCCEKQDTNKGAWSKQEDEKLISYVRAHGEGRWMSLPRAAGLVRSGKSCRLRWINYLRPDLKRGNFTEDEEDLIIKLHALLGNRWSLIAGRLPGRTDNEIKNYWNSHLRRKLKHMGIDPNNHTKQRSGIAAFHSPRGIHMCSGCAPRPDRIMGDDSLSDEASSTNDNSRVPPFLNLDLNISLPSSPQDFPDQRQHLEAVETEEDPGDTSPTLHLFR